MAVTFNWIDPTNFDDNTVAYWDTSQLLARIGTNVYAVLKEVGPFGSMERGVVYKSATFGLTWSKESGSSPHSDTYITHVHAYNSKLRVVGPDDEGTIERAEFDPAGPSWGSASGISGSGIVPDQYTVSAAHSAGPYEFTRSDGSRIIVSQSDGTPSGTGWGAVQIAKDVGGTQTLLASIEHQSANQFTNLWMAGNKNDIIHVFIDHTDGDAVAGPDFGTGHLYHVSVAANDTVSGEHSIELVGIPSNGHAEAVNTGRIDFSADGTKIAVVYSINAYSGYLSGSTEIHAAIGDLTGDPLDPSWTTETVAPYLGVIEGGSNSKVGASFQGGNTLHAYWIETIRDWREFGGIFDGDDALMHSVRTGPGTWSTPDELFADQSDGSWGNGKVHFDGVGFVHPWSGPAIGGFDLLNDMGVPGVGILISQSGYDGMTQKAWVGYNGPSFGAPRRNYASTGSLAQAGSYAAT